MDKVRLKWAMNFRRTERKLKEQRRITTVCFEQKNDGLDYLSETSDDFSEASDDIEWVAFKQSYFSAILHPDKGFRKEDGRFNIKNFGEGSKREYTNIKEMTTVLAPNFEQNNASFTWYFGPNDYNQLRSYDKGYDDILNYGIHDIDFSIEILNKHKELIFLIDSIKFDESNLTSWGNNEVFSNDQLFLEEIKINGVDLTLGNLTKLFDFNLVNDIENRNLRAIVSDGSLTMNFLEPIDKKITEIKKYISTEIITEKTQRLFNYIDKNFKAQ
jgi:hypothetical protein